MSFKYDKQPYVQVKGYENGHAFEGYEEIVNLIKNDLENIIKERKVVVIDFYPGVRTQEIKNGIIDKLNCDLSIYSDEEIFEDIDTVENKIKDVVTDIEYLVKYH